MLNSLKLLNQIKNTQGKKAKSALLKEHGTEATKTMLHCAMDPFVITHINKIVPTSADPVHSLGSKEPSISDFSKLVSKLTSVDAINNNLRHEAEEFCSKIPDKDLRNILIQVFTKRLNIGMSAKSINKLYPGLIFDKSVMLAGKNTDVVLEWKVEDIVVNIKYDGIRMIAQYDGQGNFKFYTRSFNAIPNEYLSNIEEQLHHYLHHSGINELKEFFFDGELIAKNRLKISGELNKMLSGTFVGTDSSFVYNIFDHVLDNIMTNETLICADTRPLHDRIGCIPADSATYKNLIFVKNLKIKSQDEIRQIFDDYVKDGQEGIIAKNLNAPYEYKRSEDWCKFKEIKTADLEIVGIAPGAVRSKYENTCGAIICKSSDGKLEVNVGTGLSDQDRSNFWTNKEKMIGKIIEVEYNATISSKHSGIASLFLPRFKEIRVDKTKANSFAEIK